MWEGVVIQEKVQSVEETDIKDPSGGFPVNLSSSKSTNNVVKKSSKFYIFFNGRVIIICMATIVIIICMATIVIVEISTVKCLTTF